MQREIEDNAHSAILTFQILERQHQMALHHKADLLATLARIRNEDASTIQESSDDPWQSEDCNLFALADRGGKIVALHTTYPGFSIAAAESMLHRFVGAQRAAGWWYGGSRLYQVVLQPIYDGIPPQGAAGGMVIVGREVDARALADLQAISSSQIVLRYGNEAVVSTLSPLQEQQLTQQIKDWPHPVRVQIDNEQFLAQSVDLSPGLRPAVGLIVLKSYSSAMEILNQLNRLLIGFGLAVVLAGAVLSYLISDAFTRPLASLAEGVRALGEGNFSYPVETYGGDEVAEVTQAFDRMRCTLQSNEAKKQQLEDQLRQSQKMEAMGRLAGGVAHDFNNLLTIIKGHSDLLLAGLNPSDRLSDSCEKIAKAADRAASLTRQLLAFSRMQVLQPQVLDLNALVDEMSKLLPRLIREDIVFNFLPGESLGRVKADRGQIEQVILNLAVNACDAMPQGGKLAVETHNQTVSPGLAQSRPPMLAGEYVVLSVTDTGHGMDAATKARIFEPFFTTKELGKGTGLGLATVYGVVKQSGGCIWVDTEPGKGARFEIYLPRVEGRLDRAAAERIDTKPLPSRKTVLIAEDEGAVRELASEFLRAAGYTVLAAKDGEEALAIANRGDQPIDVLLTDVVMPRVRGPELARRLTELRAGIKVVYMSGYLEYDQGNGEFLEEGFFLQKPFSRQSLVSKLKEATTEEANHLLQLR